MTGGRHHVDRRCIGAATATAIALAFAFGLASCVDAASEDELGTTHFVSGAAITNADYLPMPDTGSPGADGTGPVAPPAGAAGTSAGTMPAAPTNSGMAGASGQGALAGTGAGTGAGAGAAGNGSAGTGTAGSGTAGSGAAGSATGGPATPPTSGGTLTIEFTSVNQGGRYSPRNVGAVWIENSAGMFVKTVERWAGIRANHLTHWASVSGGWPTAFFGGGGTSADQMDAISRATLRAHEKHMLSWSLKGVDGAVVPDGTYKVGIEVTEDNFVPGAWKAVEFQKGGEAQTVMAPDAPPYSGLIIKYQP